MRTGSARRRKKQSGQAMVEYLLILCLVVFFTQFIFFNKEFGIKGMIEQSMLRMAVFLERDLKSGVRPGGRGTASRDKYEGVATWIN